jgi:hypothetical protein
VSFIDDHTKYTWIYLLRQKSDVFAVFRDFQALVERKFDKKIISLQTDWGGEYERLNSFFQQIGIVHRVSCPHAHQQNGAAERKHRHIVEVGLALLANASMPLKYWDEAFLTAARLINLLPSKVLNYQIPAELLLHEKPDYSSLRVFGCACWPNLRPFNSRKLAIRSKRCAFLGYSSRHKGFQCLDIPIGRVYISRDVIFDEDIFPFAALHENARARLRQEISLLPEHLLSPNHGGVGSNDQYLSNTDPTNPHESMSVDIDGQEIEGSNQEALGENSAGNTVQNSPGEQAETDEGGTKIGDDLAAVTSGAAGARSHADSAPATRTAPAVGMDNSAGESGARGDQRQASPAQERPTASAGGSGAAQVESGAASNPAASPTQRPKTRSQSGISKPKVYIDGTIRYANYSSTREPSNIDEALGNPK